MEELLFRPKSNSTLKLICIAVSKSDHGESQRDNKVRTTEICRFVHTGKIRVIEFMPLFDYCACVKYF